ncbi:MAG TPA: hypothetical protein VFN29_03875 [Chiayiivirga sp.]|nr:hypothetical protein [Chiayiivirga sp.]
MFKVLGAALGIYVVIAAWTGRVYIKSGPGGRTVERTQAPGYFWVCIGIYAALAVALITVF